MRTISSARQIGRAIRDKREALSMTQQQLSDAAGVSRGFISRIEKGASAAVYPDKLLNVLKTLGLTMQIADPSESRDDEARTGEARESSQAPTSTPTSNFEATQSAPWNLRIDPALLAHRNTDEPHHGSQEGGCR